MFLSFVPCEYRKYAKYAILMAMFRIYSQHMALHLRLYEINIQGIFKLIITPPQYMVLIGLKKKLINIHLKK